MPVSLRIIDKLFVHNVYNGRVPELLGSETRRSTLEARDLNEENWSPSGSMRHYIILAPPHLHTAVLFTTSGELVSATSEPLRPKDEIRIVVGLSGEVWQETKEQGYGMVDSELGKIIVLPIDDCGDVGHPFSDDHQPLMLLALNATDLADWAELLNKGKILACHLAKPLSHFREHIAVPKSSASSTKPASPVYTRSR